MFCPTCGQRGGPVEDYSVMRAIPYGEAKAEFSHWMDNYTVESQREIRLFRRAFAEALKARSLQPEVPAFLAGVRAGWEAMEAE